MSTATELQQRLKDMGFYQGKIDGGLGPVTIQAINSALDKVVVKPATKKADPAQPEQVRNVAPDPANPKATRPIRQVVIHCTATPEGREFTRAAIDAMHKARGFGMIGYHRLIHLDGKVEIGRPDQMVGAHVAGHNTGTLGFSYVGGVDADGKPKDTRTAAQKEAILTLLRETVAKYPSIKSIVGHRDLSPDKDGDGVVEPNEWIKQCPCFNAVREYQELIP